MNIIQNSPPEVLLRILFYIPGKGTVSCRKVNKKIRDFIDANEAALFKDCTKFEYPVSFSSYEKAWPYRTDWKNIYVISTQFCTANRETSNLKAAIECRKTFDSADEILAFVDMTLNVLTVFFNITKITYLGWSASRAAIRAFAAAHPELTLKEVYEILGIVVKSL